ncbi:MAG: hypothetical protein M3Y82_12295 [Verrucomicrobiota bacterium]|nr:hypothetical protein [Verrucomicrobiota bacterium]
MNRSVLIVICDFLLVSLLAFSTVDINKVSQEGSTPQIKTIIATNPPESGKDVAAVMQLALEEEQKHRDLLMGELQAIRQTARQREKEAKNFQQALQSQEQETSRLQQQQTNLQQQFVAAQTNVQTLSQKLQSSSADALISKEKLAAMEAELKKRAQEAAALQQQLAQLSRSNQIVLNERQQLAGQLQVAEVEKRHATAQAAKMQEEVVVERAEKAKLAEGVKTLATKSGELTQEIRENRPLAPNTIFSEFLTNRVQARINASRPGLFVNETTKRRETQSVLVANGANIFAICHVQNTPLTLSNPGTDWEKLTGTLARDNTLVPIRALSFQSQDPRIVLMPVTTAEARQLGGKIYRASPTPFKFQDAVLVGAAENYYGECKFEIDPSAPGYVKLNRSVLKGLFGKFNPSRGDFVFSKNGDLLGIMANSTYCRMLGDFDSSATLPFGPDLRNERVGANLARLYSTVLHLPFKLQ